MKNYLKSKKWKIVLLSVVCIIVFAAGSTIAYLQSRPKKAVNTFTIGNITTEVTEDFRKTGDWTFHKQPCIRNTGHEGVGNTCYVRARIVASPEEQIRLIGFENYAEDWILNPADGFYYYQYPLKAGEQTSPIFDSVEVKEAYRDTIEGFEVIVYQEAVQAVMTAADGTTEDDMMMIWAAYEANKIPESFQ